MNSVSERQIPLLDLQAQHKQIREEVLAEIVRVVDSKRFILGEDVNSRTIPWTATPTQTVTKPGPISAHIDGLSPTGTYEFRAVIHHPLLALYGAELSMKR